MRSSLLAAACLLAAVVGSAPAHGESAHANTSPRVLCRVGDERIGEASGIAPGLASPGVLYVHNDSGDSNRFFALDAHSCDTVATIAVRGARNVDWEDIAVGPDAAGMSSVWLADTGDNGHQRREVAVYRVAEPRVAAETRGVSLRTATADVWRLRYPTGPADAESLAVLPGGTGYLVTKAEGGHSVVYRMPSRPDTGRVRVLHRVGAIAFASLAGGGGTPFSIASGLLATGAAASRDGSRFAVRTYAAAYVWTVRDGDVAGALRITPATVALPAQRQGEGIAFRADGRRLLIDSEGTGSTLYAVPVPRAAPSPTGPSVPVSPSGQSAPSASATSGGKYGGGGSWLPGIVVLVLVVLGTAGWWLLRRAPARERDDR